MSWVTLGSERLELGLDTALVRFTTGLSGFAILKTLKICTPLALRFQLHISNIHAHGKTIICTQLNRN